MWPKRRRALLQAVDLRLELRELVLERRLELGVRRQRRRITRAHLPRATPKLGCGRAVPGSATVWQEWVQSRRRWRSSVRAQMRQEHRGPNPHLFPTEGCERVRAAACVEPADVVEPERHEATRRQACARTNACEGPAMGAGRVRNIVRRGTDHRGKGTEHRAKGYGSSW